MKHTHRINNDNFKYSKLGCCRERLWTKCPQCFLEWLTTLSLKMMAFNVGLDLGRMHTHSFQVRFRASWVRTEGDWTGTEEIHHWPQCYGDNRHSVARGHWQCPSCALAATLLHPYKNTLCSASLNCVFDKAPHPHSETLQDFLHRLHSVWNKPVPVCAGVMHQWAILWQTIFVNHYASLARNAKSGPGCPLKPQAFLFNLVITYETITMLVNVAGCFSNKDAHAQALHVELLTPKTLKDLNIWENENRPGTSARGVSK